jgi:hypothetical protein
VDHVPGARQVVWAEGSFFDNLFFEDVDLLGLDFFGEFRQQVMASSRLITVLLKPQSRPNTMRVRMVVTPNTTIE